MADFQIQDQACVSPPLRTQKTLSLRLFVRRNHIVVPATEQHVDYYQIFKEQNSSPQQPPDPSASAATAATKTFRPWIQKVGGGERDRTDDPLLAKQVLSQLSYTPNESSETLAAALSVQRRFDPMVGLDGLEPSTPALSRRCSNQLSYRPRNPTAFFLLPAQ